MTEDYKVLLGIDLDEKQLSSVKTTINNLVDKERKINLDIDFNIKNAGRLADVGREIEKIQNQLKELNNVGSVGKGTSPISINSKSLETSLNKIHETIKKVQNAFGRVDKNKGVQSLLTTVSKISAELANVSKQFEGLNRNLSSLSSKDFSLNFDFGFSKNSKSPEQISSELKMLKKEAEEYEKFFEKFYSGTIDKKSHTDNKADGISRLIGQYNSRSQLYLNQLRNTMWSGEPSQKQIAAYKEYLSLIKETAAIGKIELAPVEFRLAESGEFVKVRNEADETKKQLQELFSGGINAENLHRTLDGISADLHEIGETLKGLSSGISVEGLTSSFDKLSETIEKLVSNVTLAKNALGDGLGNDVNVNTNSINNIEKTSDAATSAVIQNEKKKQEAYKATADAVIYHAGIISRLNKAETNGRFYGSNRGTGYFGTGHYFVDSATKHELDSNGYYNKLPYTSVDISKYDNLFKATTDEVADRLHTFLANLTAFTQGSDGYDVSELFAQFKNVFGDTIMDIKEFGSRLDQLKAFMSSSSMDDRSDSVSTQFMKSLGYEGVDTRGTRFADTRYGTVIYDLKEESILQANITDELQKQGQMLEKINYAKGQVFDKDEDDRIQGIIDAQNKRREINEEFKNSFDTTGFDKADNDLLAAKNRLTEIDETIQRVQHSLNNLDREYREFSREMSMLGLDDDEILLWEDEDEWKQNKSEDYQNYINQLSQEKAELQSKIPVLEEVYNKESQLANEAYERAKQTVEQRHLESQQAQKTANVVVQNEERKQRVHQETVNMYDKISRAVSLVRDDVNFQKSFEESNQAAQEAQRHFQQLLADEKAVVSVVEQFDNNNALQSFVVNVKRASGEIETLRYAMDKLDGEENGRFRYQSGSATDRNVEKQLETRIKKANDLQIKLDKIKTEYSDMGHTKPIKNSDYITSLDEQYEKVKKAIIDVRNADDSTFTSMISNAEKEKSALESMVKVYRNADNVSNSLKGTDFASGVQIRIEELGKFKAQASDFPQMTKTIKELDRAIEGVGDKSSLDSFTDQLKVARAELAKVKAETVAANRQEKVGIDVSGATSRIVDIQRISPEIDDFKAQINGAEVTVESLLNDLSKVNTAGDFSVVNRRLGAFEEAAKSSGIAVTEAVTKISSVNKIKNKLSDTGFNGFEQEVSRAHIEAEKLEGATTGLESALKRLDVAMEAVYSADQANDAKRLIAANEEYELSLKQVYSQLKLNQQAEKESFNAEMLAQKKASLSSEMEIWLKENTRAAKDFGEEIRRLQASLDGLDDKGVKLVGQQFKTITKQAQAMGKTGLTVFDKLKAKAKEYMAYLSAAELFMYAEQALREMFNTVKEIDTAMTGLYRVTDLTSAEYDSLFNNMISSAKEYGATLNDIINATTDWVRAGFDANTALGLAEVTTMYQHISDLDYDTAAENLITAYNGFKDELNGAFSGDTVASVNYIADIFNELDNNFAVTSAGLGEALTRSASALDLAGNSIQETAGMITGIVEVTQDPEKAGSALKVLSLRLRGMKGQLEELGEETDENVENVSKMQGQIFNMTGGKVNIFDGTEFRSTYEIMRDIANVYDDLSSTDQADLLETIAGKNRANDVAALLSNWENVEAAVKSASEAEGSAARENAKYVDSIQGRLDKLTTTWQSFANTFMSSDFLKGAVSALTSFVEGLEKVIETVGTFPALMGTIATGMSFKNKGFFSVLNKDIADAEKQLSLFGKSFKDISRDFQGGQGLFTSLFSKSITKSDVGYITEYFNQIKSGVPVGQAYANTLSHASVAGKKMAVNIKKGTVSMNSLKTATIGGKAALFGLEVAATAANIALTMGLSLAIQGIVNLVSKWINADKELAESVEELTSKYKQQSDELKKLKNNYDTSNESSMINKYAKLSKGVDNLGRNVSLTSDEYSEYQSIVSKIAEQIPSLVSGYDSQGNALLSCKGNVEELVKAYEELIHTQNQQILIQNSGNIEKSFKNAISQSSGYDFFEHMGNGLSFDGVFGGDLEHFDMKFGTAQNLEKLLVAKTKEERKKILKKITSDDYQQYEVVQALQNAGVDVNIYSDLSKVFDDLLSKEPEKLQNILTNYYAQFDEVVEQQKSIAKAKLSEAFDIRKEISGLDYSNIGEGLQDIAYQIVNGLDLGFFKKLQEEDKTVEQWTTHLLDQLNSLKESDGDVLETAFNLKTQFNDGEISYGDYIKGIQEAEEIINKLDLEDEVKNTIKLSINDDEIKTQYNHLQHYLTEKIKTNPDESRKAQSNYNRQLAKIKSFLNSLTADELQAVIDLKTEIDWENTSAEEIRKQIEDQVKLNEALRFSTSIEVDKTALEALNTALEESASAMGLSEESIDSLKAKYSDLEGYNPHTLFEKTANGVKVNREELAKLEKKYNDLTKTEVQEHLDTLVEEYNKCTKAIDGNIGSQEKLELISKREKYAQQIEELAEYQAQLEGVTGAYQKWIDAQNAPEDYEGYESIATGKEDIQDEIDRGFISNKGKAYIDLLSGKDLQGGTIDDYYNAWKRLDEKVGSTTYSIHDFFTVNDDGDITSTGIDRFFKGIQQDFEGSVAKFDEKTGQWQYNFSQENLQKIQDEWGIGIEAIELLLEGAAAAGYDVDWGGLFDDLDLDASNFESVEAMISLAEKAQEEFNKLKGVEDVEFNFRTNTIAEATTEVEKARKAYVDLITNKDGTINLKAEGAEQMQFMLATLLTQKQQLSTPAIMKVDTSQIDKAETDIIDVINKAKALQTAYENYEIAITTGVDVESAKADLNSAIEGMKGTSVDVRADLKLPTNEELTNAANGIGSIKVGASLDGTSIGAIATKIQTECTPEVIAKVTGLDETAIQNGSQQVVYTAEHSDVDNFINGLSDISKKIIYTYTTEGTKPNPSNIERSITYKYQTEGDVPEVNGTANANGTAQSGRAFVRGNWGIKGSGTALVGELGMETLVRGSRFYTIGDNGAEFIKYKQGDIIFNHKQTEELFKNGKVTSDGGRGRMFANGSAFAEGTALWQASASGSKFATNRLIKTGGGSSKKTKKDNSEKKNVSVNTTVAEDKNATSVKTDVNYNANVSESDFAKENQENQNKGGKGKEKFEETWDWIAIAIERIEREIDNLDKKVNNTYKSWGDRNTALSQEIAEVGKEIALQNDAADEYWNRAGKSLDHNSTYAKQIQNGTLNIEDFEGEGDEALVEKIKEYQKW